MHFHTQIAKFPPKNKYKSVSGSWLSCNPNSSPENSIYHIWTRTFPILRAALLLNHTLRGGPKIVVIPTCRKRKLQYLTCSSPVSWAPHGAFRLLICHFLAVKEDIIRSACTDGYAYRTWLLPEREKCHFNRKSLPETDFQKTNRETWFQQRRLQRNLLYLSNSLHVNFIKQKPFE